MLRSMTGRLYLIKETDLGRLHVSVDLFLTKQNIIRQHYSADIP